MCIYTENKTPEKMARGRRLFDMLVERIPVPTSAIHTLSAPPSATRSNGWVSPLVNVTAGSWARHEVGRHDPPAVVPQAGADPPAEPLRAARDHRDPAHAMFTPPSTL